MGRIGEIVAAHGDAYREHFESRMSLDQRRTLRDLEACHTSASGAVLWHCPECDARHFTYLGCGNRHCPQCGQRRAGQWLKGHCALLLPSTTYHLVTFTVPESLRRIIRSHPRELLDLLIKQSATTLFRLAANDKWLGATPGATAVLHTWTRQLEYHPHVHFIATGGGMDRTGLWRTSHPRFLVPVRALSEVFRGRVRDRIRKRHPEIFARVSPHTWTQPWVVHSKPVGEGESALTYLSRYVHRVALADSAILHHDAEKIVLRYRKSGTNQPRTLRLRPQEFLRRFLQHVLPAQFRKVRYYGLHHSSKRPVLQLLQAAMRMLHGLPPPSPRIEPPSSLPCPCCEKPMRVERVVSANPEPRPPCASVSRRAGTPAAPPRGPP